MPEYFKKDDDDGPSYGAKATTQYSSKDALWEALKQAADSIPSSLIGKLTVGK